MAEKRIPPSLAGQAAINAAAYQRVNSASLSTNAVVVTAGAALGLAATAIQPSSFTDNEVPTGTINGTNKVFVLAHTPIAASLKIYRDGLRTTDYVLATATITFGTTAPTTSVLCDYRR